MLRAGFIGFGRMGITHYSILNTHPSVKIASVCDQSKTTLGILDKYLEVEIYSGYQEMIDRSELDFVVISTPADSHLEIIHSALDKDLHIFCEKPLATDSVGIRKCLDLVKVAESKKLNIVVGLQRHYQTNYRSIGNYDSV